MTTLIQANIFFFITSVVTIVLAIGVAILLFYIIKITRNIEYISKKIKEESDNVTDDIAAIRTRIREEGMKVAPISSIFSRFFGPKKEGHREAHRPSPRRKTPRHEPSTEEEAPQEE